MVGNTYYESTSIDWMETTATTSNWNDTTTSTIQSSETNTTTGYDVYITYVDRTDYYYEKIKEILRKQVILDMKSKWMQEPKHMKPMPIMRPTHQLKNICFGGRGWA